MKTSMIKWSTILLAVSLAGTFESCQKTGSSNSNGNSSVRIFLTDYPSLVFDKLLLDIKQLEIKVEDDDQQHHESEHQHDADDNDDHGDKSGGWMAIPV